MSAERDPELERRLAAMRANGEGGGAPDPAAVLVRTSEGDKVVPAPIGTFMLLGTVISELHAIRELLEAQRDAAASMLAGLGGDVDDGELDDAAGVDHRTEAEETAEAEGYGPR